MNSEWFLRNIDGTSIKETLKKNLVSIQLGLFKLPKNLDKKVIFLLKINNVAVDVSMLKTIFSTKSVSGCD